MSYFTLYFTCLGDFFRKTFTTHQFLLTDLRNMNNSVNVVHMTHALYSNNARNINDLFPLKSFNGIM